MNGRTITGLAACLFMGVFSAVGAVPRYSLEDLVARSQLIVQGTVEGQWSAWDSTHRHIWTHYRIQVTDAVRGLTVPIVVSEPGGSLNGIGQGGAETVMYSAHERVLLFLFQTPNGYLRTTGGSQGKFTVSPDGSASPDLHSSRIVDMGGRAGTGLDTLHGVPVMDLKTRIRKMARPQ
jgi:hypothetical protein